MELDDDVLRYYVETLFAEPCSVTPEWYVARFGHRHKSGEPLEVIAERHPDEAARRWAADVLSTLQSSRQTELGRMHLTAAQRRLVEAEIEELGHGIG